jgi:hypothetical protein
MAGTIRRRAWITRKGETKTAWLADYFDQKRKRHTKQFPTKKTADAWLLRARGEVRDGVHTPDSASITIAAAGECGSAAARRMGWSEQRCCNIARISSALLRRSSAGCGWPS